MQYNAMQSYRILILCLSLILIASKASKPKISSSSWPLRISGRRCDSSSIMDDYDLGSPTDDDDGTSTDECTEELDNRENGTLSSQFRTSMAKNIARVSSPDEPGEKIMTPTIKRRSLRQKKIEQEEEQKRHPHEKKNIVFPSDIYGSASNDDASDGDDDIGRRLYKRITRENIGSYGKNGPNGNRAPIFPTRNYTNNKKKPYKKKKKISSIMRPNWFPKLRMEPTTTFKISKTFRRLKTIVKIGAYFNIQSGVWQFKSSWEDAIIGGKITLAGNELQISKSWQLGFGAVEDLATRLRFRAAVDLTTMRAYMRVGFRTEKLAPIDTMEGFTLVKYIPLDGKKGNVKLECKAYVALPEPEIEYSTESQKSTAGLGDIEVMVDELNFLLDY